MDPLAPVLGVDACAGGWIGVGLHPAGDNRAGPASPTVQVVAFGPTIADLVAGLPETSRPALIGVDIPIHPPDREVRVCDLAARRYLGGRRQSSVFVTPVRAALAAATYDEAVERSRATTGKGISRQAWALRTKILEVDGWLDRAPCPVHEVHPEISFSLMAGAPIVARKSSWAGFTARRAALQEHGIVLPDDLGEAGLHARPDDVLDAAAVAWSAHRIATGAALVLPDPPPVLPDGRSPAIRA